MATSLIPVNRIPVYRKISPFSTALQHNMVNNGKGGGGNVPDLSDIKRKSKLDYIKRMFYNCNTPQNKEEQSWTKM